MEKSPKKVTQIHKKFYWSVTKGDKLLHGGTFSSCWNYLMGKFCNSTCRQLTEQGIRIARAS